MKVIIIGGGALTFFLTRAFIEKGYDVNIIVKSYNSAKRFEKQKTFKVGIIIGDGTNTRVLEEAGADSTDVLVAVTNHDYINLICCQMGSIIFKIPNTLAVVNDPDNFNVYKKMGINFIFNKTTLIVSMLERSAESICARPIVEYADGQLLLYDIQLLPGMKAVGTEIYRLNLPPGARIVGFIREGVFEPYGGKIILQEYDKLLLASYPKAKDLAIRALCT
jgi:trk system potassium uptake protein